MLKHNFVFDLENLFGYRPSAVSVGLVLDLFQGLRSLFSYYQYALMSLHQLEK